MSEIVSFEEFTSANQIIAHSTQQVRIVLEGQDDKKLFQTYWFNDYQSRFEFIAAETLPGGAGGSEGVIKGVRDLRDQGLEAYGLIDRDTLFRKRNWLPLYGIEDDILVRYALHEHVYTTKYWEIEAYVLDDVERLRDWVEGNFNPPPAPQQDCDAALERAIEECEVLLEASPPCWPRCMLRKSPFRPIISQAK